MNPERSVLISFDNVSVFQEDNTLTLADVDFEMKAGEFYYLLGKTGSGKSSLIRTLIADLPIGGGKASVAGFQFPVKSKDIPLLRRKVGVIFQDFQLLSDRSVYDNLAFVLKATGWKDKNLIRNRISEVLMQVGIEYTSGKMPHQLSGGEQQRVSISRAILNEPVLLIADEPTGNLDPETGREIMKLFQKINRNGTAILMATHNPAWPAEFPASEIICRDGRLLVPSKPSIITQD
jgi:cell division transport system ATP-binding protein